jgi:hypothetical protein
MKTLEKSMRIRAKLLLQGLTLQQFSEKHGFNPATVSTVIGRYWGEPDRRPYGEKTREILSKLEKLAA